MSIHVNTVGTIATAPKLLNAEGRIAFCSFRLACNDRRFDREKNEWVELETNWLTIHTFRTLAEHAFRSFSTGDRVTVIGRLRVRNWENSGKSGTSVEVEVESIGHDLRWGTSQFSKTVRAAAPEVQSPPAPPAAAVPPVVNSIEQTSWVPPQPAMASADGFTPSEGS